MSKEKKAIVVGAGLVGALWTVLLARKGYTVDLYERRGDMRKVGFIGGRSINLAMSDRGWKALEKAGASERLRESAIPMRGRMLHDSAGKLAFQPYGTADQAIYSVSRGGLNLELLQIADSYEKVRLHFDMRCRGVDFEKNLVRFENTETGDLKTAEAPLIFGADGAFSAVRMSMQKTNRFNYSQQYLNYGYKELCIPPDENNGFRMEKNALHIWPRGTFMLIALPNVDGTFTCTLFLPFEGKDAFENLQTDDQVMAFFRKYFPDAVPLMPTLLEDFRFNPTSSLVTVKCDPWHHANTLLLGDAAHAIVPFYGQGMNAGFEDCTILDDMIDVYDGDWDRIIPEFSKSRVKDGQAIADLALRNFVEMRDLVADPRFLLRKKIAAKLHEKYPDFLPVYSMVTFSHLPYNQALEESFEQDKLFERILSIDNIEEKWDGAEVETAFEAWRKEKM